MRRLYAALMAAAVIGLGWYGSAGGQAPALPEAPRPLSPVEVTDAKDQQASKESLPPMPAPRIELPALPDLPDVKPITTPVTKPELKPVTKPDTKPENKPADTQLPLPVAAPVITTPPALNEKGKEESNGIALPLTPAVPGMPAPQFDAPKKSIGLGAAAQPTPAVRIDALAPETVGIGQNISYELVIKNVGNTFVSQVEVEDELPSGCKLQGSDPPAEVLGDRLQWAIGGLDAGAERRIRVQVKPNGEAEFHTKPTVTFAAATALAVRITRPKLQLDVQAPEAASVGDEVVFDVKVTNAGDGTAAKLLLEAEPTRGLAHPQMQAPNVSRIQAELQGLSPGETRTVKLRTQAIAAGAQTCAFTASAYGSEKIASVAHVQLHQPNLQLKLVHAPRCIVRAEPVFQLELLSNGTTTTPAVQLAAALPEGLDFIAATDGGNYDPVTRNLHWTLPAQAAGVKKTITVKTRASAAGNLAFRAVAQAGSRIDTRAEGVISVEGVPALGFDVIDLADPVEVGKETVYEIKLTNQGTCVLTNIRLAVALSDGLELVGVNAPVAYKTQERTLVFEPIGRLAIKGEQVVRIKVKGGKPGDQRFKAQYTCDQIRTPVVKEESTSIYVP